MYRFIPFDHETFGIHKNIQFRSENSTLKTCISHIYFLQLIIYSHWDNARYPWYLAYDFWNIIGFKIFSFSIEFLLNIWQTFFHFSIEFLSMLDLFYFGDVEVSSIFLCRSDTYISENPTMCSPIILSVLLTFYLQKD